jgi:hypothetical protein
MREFAVAPIQYRGVALRHFGPRDAIETDVEHGCLLKWMELETAATGFHGTRLTEASFIVSTPTCAGRLTDASVGATEVRGMVAPLVGSHLIARGLKLRFSAPRSAVTASCRIGAEPGRFRAVRLF